MIELTLRVGAGDAEEVLDAVLPTLPGGAHVREAGGAVLVTIASTPGTPDEKELRRLVGSRLIDLTAAEASDDWRERRLARYEPLVVAERFLLRPDWAPPSDDRNLIEIVLEQGPAFGTGLHPTTQACLATMAEVEAFAPTLQDVASGPRFASVKIDGANLERVLSSRDANYIVNRIRGALGFQPI